MKFNKVFKNLLVNAFIIDKKHSELSEGKEKKMLDYDENEEDRGIDKNIMSSEDKILC